MSLDKLLSAVSSAPVGADKDGAAIRTQYVKADHNLYFHG